MAKKIVEYQLFWHWHDSKNCGVKVKLEDGDVLRQKITASELAALAIILQEEPVYMQSNGYIRTGVERVEDK